MKLDTESNTLRLQKLKEKISEIEKKIRAEYSAGKFDEIIDLIKAQINLTINFKDQFDGKGDPDKYDSLKEKISQGIKEDLFRPPLEKLLHYHIDRASIDWELTENAETYLNNYLDELEKTFDIKANSLDLYLKI